MAKRNRNRNRPHVPHRKVVPPTSTSRPPRRVYFILAVIIFGGVLFFGVRSKNKRTSETQTVAPPLEMIVPEEDHLPTAEEAAWAKTHLQDVWDSVERDYPIASVRSEFVHVLGRLRRQEIVANISVEPNPASSDVNCAADTRSDGKQRMTFYLLALQRIERHVDAETYKDVVIDCMVHENIHLEEQMMFESPTAKYTWEEFARGEAEAWCLTTARVLVPMRGAGRASAHDWGRQEALAIYDHVGATCDDPLWIEFGRTMSPYNPQGNYK